MALANEKFGFATLVGVRSATDCLVRLENGREIPASLDAAALRARLGRVYGLNLGARVELSFSADGLARIVDVEQSTQSSPPPNKSLERTRER